MPPSHSTPPTMRNSAFYCKSQTKGEKHNEEQLDVDFGWVFRGRMKAFLQISYLQLSKVYQRKTSTFISFNLIITQLRNW